MPLARQGSRLAQTFAERERGRARQVHRTYFRPHGQPNTSIAGFGDGSRHTRAFLAEKQHITRPEAKIVGRFPALGGEQNQPARTDARPEGIEVGIARYGDVIDIVHGGAADPTIIPSEAHRLDQVHRHAQASAEPQDGADVPGNLRLEESDAHTG